MNKNKIIIIIIWVIIIVLMLFIALNSKYWKTTTKRWKSVAEFDIWIMWDNDNNFIAFLDEFKKYNILYKGTSFNVETFSDYEEYSYSLASAIIAWKAPDLFVLNNNETSIFEEHTFWVGSDVISINDFRKKYKTVFSDDLIVTLKDWDKDIELLKWIPIWYETLWIFYNRKRGIKSSDLLNLTSLSKKISALTEKYPREIPLWMWNWKNVRYSSDIITQFFLFEKNVNWIDTLDSGAIRSGLTSYLLYWDNSWNNKFDNARFNNSYDNNIDLFSDWKISMIVWYPRMIREIDKRWYWKNNLDAILFPQDSSSNWRILVNYNYFATNKESKNTALWNSILKYMTTKEWVERYSEQIPYYLPAIRDFEEELLENKINPWYNIILKDFYNESYELSSFDKWVISIFDKEVEKILDMDKNYVSSFEELNIKLKCKRDKYLKLTNLSKPCE